MAAGILLWVPDNAGANWPVIVPLDGDVWLWLDGDARDYLELVLEDNGLRSGEMLDVTFEGSANGLVVETAQAISGEAHLLPGLQAQADGQLRLGDFVFRNHNGWVQYRAHGADGAPWNPIASVAEFSTRILGIALGAAELKTLLAVLFAERRLDVLLLPIDPGFLLVPCLADGFPGSPLGIVEELHRGVRDEREQEEAESRRRAAQFRNAVQLEEYRKTFDSEEIFVNPYNFVPLTEEVIRTEPVDRSVLAAGRRMGHIDVEWVAATPLLFGNGVGADRTGLEQDEDHRYRVAGSSLKGAISSLHEALCGSCLRVAELDFVPAYRETPALRARSIGIVIGRSDVSGEPTRVLLSSETAWCHVEAIHRAGRDGTLLRTGDILRLPGAALGQDGHGRPMLTIDNVEMQYVTTVDVTAPGGAEIGVLETVGADDWIVLVGPSGLRTPNHPFSVALGKLHNARVIDVDPDANRRWRAEIAGSTFAAGIRDGHRRTLTPVTYPGRLRAGSMVTMAQMPEPGDVLWVEVAQQKVSHFSASYIWRISGTGTVRNRLPDGAVTCGDAGSLDAVCPSCELFGAIAGAGLDDPSAEAVHQALRGLVRFSHLSIDTFERPLEQRSLPPRGAPSMGAGQFYLTIENTAPGDPPTAQWGSTHDNTAAGLRRMRGRKFYWHADSPEVDMANGAWSRASARPHHLQRAGMGAQQVELVPAGSKVRARLHFENLDDRQLGSLIAAIAPDLALREFLPTTWIDTTGTGERRKLRTHLGGAKPLGLGSVEVCTVAIHVENERYRSGAAATALTAEEISELAGAFVASIAQHGTDHLVALAAMLDPDRVRSDRVSYPPGGRWGAVDSQTFDSPFTFFATTRGRQVGGDHGHIVALPRPEMNPWMNIDGTPEGGGDV